MPEGMDEATIAFGNDLETPVQPRDSAGKFVSTSERPEPMFGLRPLEGDPLTGDTSDGGDNQRLREREREIADGRFDEREDSQRSSRSRQAPAENEGQGSQRRRADAAQRNDAAADDGHSGTEVEPENIWDILAEGEDVPRADERSPAEVDRRDAVRDAERDAEAGEKFEVTVDGETHHVTLQEALRGYVRQATFHKRMNHLNEVQGQLETYDTQLRSNWAWWDKARRDYEEDLTNLIPAEPDWDQEFAADPHQAHAKQKIFQTLYGKLQQSRGLRAQRETAEAAETDRRVQKYAVDGFSRFVMDSKIPDEPTLTKNIQSMRRTAKAMGFSDYEVATVYDPRMLGVLLKASKYDRMMAARPRAVIPGKGRTLTPGSATPLGNAPRRGLDEALRRQASSGRLDDTAEVFRRLL
jgi:hypothetical protein